MNLKKTLYIIVAIAAVVAIVVMAIIYRNFDPLHENFFPKCAFFSLTGYMCPGCGGQRAVHALLCGNFVESFRYNPLLHVSMAYFFILLVLRFPFLGEKASLLREHLTGLTACVIWLVAIIAFWILRNIV